MILKNLKIAGRGPEEQDITVDGEIISQIKSSQHNKETTEEINIDFSGCIAFPGLINSHDHLEFNIYPRLGHKIYEDYVEWGDDIHLKDKKLIDTIENIPVDLRMKFGIIKNLICGVTSVAHHGSYNSVLDESPVNIITKGTCIHSVRLGGKWKVKINLPDNNEPYVIHVGEGINLESKKEIDELIRWNLFKRKLAGIHGIAMTEEQSKNFCALIWCPDSNLFLFEKTADINSLKKFTKILFGTDSTLTADRSMQVNLRKARKLGMLSDEELFHSVTSNAAEFWEMKDLGVIAEGKKADLVISAKRKEDQFDSFYETDSEDILLIVKNGKIILFDAMLKNVLISILKNINDFREFTVRGISKFTEYDVSGIIKQINKFIPFEL